MNDDFRALFEADQGLPGRYFTDPQLFEIEKRRVLEASWLCIGLSADVPAKGDLRPLTVLNQPLVMVRDSGTLRVFHNVCSHRGAVLVEEALHGGPRIVCPYHSWSYRLDGELASTPHVGGADQHDCAAIDRSKLGLRQVVSAEWAGFVFVNLSGTAVAFDQWIAPVAQRFHDIDWSLLRRDASLSRELCIAANWKIVVENFVESYHVPWVHRTLNTVNPMQAHYQILGGHSYLGQGGTGYTGDQMAGSVLPRMPGITDPTCYEALAIFPNLILAPLSDMTFALILSPESAERTRERVEFFFVGDRALSEEYSQARRAGADFVASVNAEDVRIVESVQRGRYSPAFVGGQFAAAQETTSLQFQKVLAARWLAEGAAAPQDIVPLPIREIYHPTQV